MRESVFPIFICAYNHIVGYMKETMFPILYYVMGYIRVHVSYLYFYM